MPGAIGIVLFDDAGLLLDDLRFGTGAGHGRAEEDVDDEHDQEEDAESDAQVQQPQRLDPRARSHCHCNQSQPKIPSFILPLNPITCDSFFLTRLSGINLFEISIVYSTA